MFANETIMEKWSAVLDHEGAPKFQDDIRKGVTAAVLENTEKALSEERDQQVNLAEAAPTNVAGGVSNWDPILISMVRRTMPNLIAYDLAGVQPMQGPTGLIFAMRSKYSAQNGTEALVNEADSGFSGIDDGGTSAHGGDSSSLPAVTSGGALEAGSGSDANSDTVHDSFGFGGGMTTAEAEALGGATGDHFQEMAFSIEKATVTAKSRALKAEYTTELAQDLKAVHGLNAESELASILSGEIVAEVNREMVRTINSRAKLGAQHSDLANSGVFDLDVDADGRWSVEKYKGMLVQIEREANTIAKETRRGKGNFLLVSSDVAAALSAASMLDHTPALSTKLDADDTGVTFLGTINGRMKVYLDPYATVNYVTVGYRGSNAYDAGMFYCPYVPLTMMKAVGENTFQPKIGFKTRYGMVANPFVGSSAGDDIGAVRSNQYYRVFVVRNILGS